MIKIDGFQVKFAKICYHISEEVHGNALESFFMNHPNTVFSDKQKNISCIETYDDYPLPSRKLSFEFYEL